MEELDLLDILRILRKYLWMIALLLVVSIIGVLTVNELMAPVYQADATVLVQRDAVGMAFMDMPNLNNKDILNYVEILKSRTIAERVAERMYPDKEITAALVGSIRKSISVSTVAQTDMIKISAISTDQREAMELVNTYVEVFVEDSRDANQSQARIAREFIEAQVASVSAELLEAEEKLLEFKKNEGTVYPTEETKAVLEQIAKLEAEKAELAISLSETRTRLNEVYRQLEAQDETVISSKTITDNPILTEYKKRLTNLELELSIALERFTERHPTVVALQTEITEVKQRIEREVERIISAETVTTNPLRQSLLGEVIALETSQAALVSRQDALVDVIAEVESRLTTLPEKELELARLLREQTVAERIYMILLENLEEAKIAEAREIADIRLVDPAVYPRTPIKPRKMLNLAIGGVLALCVGCGMALALEYFDTTIKTSEDVERILGLPVMGAIPNLESASRRRRKRKGKVHSTGVPLNN
jgi:polysaccharide chain length determinant protein (PEP-CTERM system associated)